MASSKYFFVIKGFYLVLNYFNCDRKKATGNDSKFFSTNRKGENHELREELRSPQRDRKKDAVKKVFDANEMNVMLIFICINSR